MKDHEPIPPEIEKYSRPILDAVYAVHSAVGPGLLESVYEMCLTHELKKRGIKFERQVALPVVYDNIKMEGGFRIDVLAEDCIIIELKSINELMPVHEAQLLTYLRLSNLRLGFLLNFNVPSMKRGIKRLVV